jgi:glycosyltransferase involved in cell wall biosynthesis
MKKVSIVTPVLNEEENIFDIINQTKKIMSEYNELTYEHIFIDNFSTDGTVEKLISVAQKDKNIKVILNTKNFGYVRSSYHGIMQASGDAVVLMAGDLQDPPSLLKSFIAKWLEGKKIILAQKESSKESFFMNTIRKLFYKFIRKISDTNLTVNTIGFGLFDKTIINSLKMIRDPYPYFRGLLTEVSEEVTLVAYEQPLRQKGKTKFDFFLMYDLAITGIVKHSKIPIRIFTLMGFLLSALSLLSGIIYFFYKIFNWYSFESGIAPILIGVFILGSFQIFLLGLIGEYLINVHTQVRNIPLVFEKERINF